MSSCAYANTFTLPTSGGGTSDNSANTQQDINAKAAAGNTTYIYSDATTDAAYNVWPYGTALDFQGMNAVFRVNGADQLATTDDDPGDTVRTFNNVGDFALGFGPGSWGDVSFTKDVNAAGTTLWITEGSDVTSATLSGTSNDGVAGVVVDGTLGTLNNTGTLNGGQAGLLIASGATVGTVNNSGTLSGKYGIINQGTLSTINNTGTISGGILNSGTITDSLALNGLTLTLAGDAASVGDISGTAGDGSAIAIGDADNQANFTATGNASVDTLSVAADSVLTVADTSSWRALSASDDAISNAGTVVMANGSTLTGNLTNSGTLTLSDASAATATLAGNVTNSGSIVLNPTATSAGNTLTIDGNYTGVAGSSVSLGSVLAGDDSLTDKLVITGNTAGTSALNITNENGSGAQTLEGI